LGAAALLAPRRLTELTGLELRQRTLGLAAAAVAAIAAADTIATLRQRRAQEAGSVSEAYLQNTVVVNKTPQECYDFWRDLRNISKFSSLVKSVSVLDDHRSHWTLRGVLSSTLEWDTEIIAERPGERIAWRSVDGSQIDQAGVVRFERAPGGRGTLVHLSMHYMPPRSSGVFSITRWIGTNPQSELREDLRRFKQLIETGEIPTTRGQPSGRRSMFGRATREGRLSREGKPI
jgi:uncharacterized membrane protein